MTNSSRINQISLFVSKRVVAEVGADHGFITKNLFETNKIDFAYLTDISNKCLQKSINNFKNTSYNCKFLVGDGLEALKNEDFKNSPKPEEIIIAGMGGNEIIKILQNKEANKFNFFVLQPQKNVVELRKFLQERKFLIEKDFMVKDGKIYYNVLKVVRTNCLNNLTEEEILFGKTNLISFNPDFENYILHEIEKNKEILNKKSLPEIIEKLEKLNAVYKKIKGA